MKRPALYLGFPYLLGLLLASKCTSLILVVMITAGIGIILYQRAVWKYVLLGTLSCVIACCSYWHDTEQIFQKQKDFAGLECTFTGQVISKTTYESGYANYLLKGRITNFDTPANIELLIEETDYQYGDTMTISGRPELISSSYLFDSESYDKSRKLFLRFNSITSIPEISDVKPLEHETLFSRLYHWRTCMTERILSHMSEDTGAMLISMLFGDKSNLRHSVRTSLYRSGIGHMLAVSGLHLDFLALCINQIFDKLKTGRRIRFLFVAVLCSLFVICAGGTVSVKRACIMIFLSQSAGLFFRKANALNSLSIAIFLLGIENPFVIHSPAFWLSCSGAYGIGVSAYLTKDFPHETFYHLILKDLLAFTCTFLIVFPISAVYFREVSLISPLTNLFLAPVCLCSIALGMIAVCVGGQGIFAEIVLIPAEKINQLVLEITDFLAGLAWTHTSTDSQVLIFVTFAGTSLTLLCYLLYQNKKLLIISATVAFFVTCIAVNLENAYQKQDLHIAMLGTKNHCLLIVRHNTEAILFDMTGESSAPEYASAYLEQSGVHKLKSLYLCRPKDKTVRKYSEYLKFFNPEELWLFKKTEMPMPPLLDCETHSAEEKELLFHGAKIRISQKQFLLEYAGKLYCCKNDRDFIQEKPDILTIYGNNKTLQKECGILIIPDDSKLYVPDSHTYLHENNLDLTISENGKCRVRRLYAIH